MTVERPKIPVDRRFKSDRPHTSESYSLDIVASEIRSCSLCPLANGRTLAVPGEGPRNARIVMVGEAPGKEEDLSGRPFVGRSGRLLDSVLESVGISRSDIFVTSVVKCRPPKNRLPTNRESQTCKDAHLRRQLGAINPEIVVLLGRSAARAVLDADSLAQVRGKILRRGRTEYLSTYHPAAVLRNPRLRATLTKDLRKLRTHLAG
jgi:DNA polymerase